MINLQMDANEFNHLVADMRTAQRHYFRSGSASALADSKALERRVDAVLAVRVGSDGYRQRGLAIGDGDGDGGGPGADAPGPAPTEGVKP